MTPFLFPRIIIFKKPHNVNIFASNYLDINMARPRIKLDWEQFDKLCNLLCTQQEIADFFGCSPDTISRAIEREFKVGYAEYYKRVTVHAKVSLRRIQWKHAEKSVAMAIWLGKQYLKQSDSPMEIDNDLPSGFNTTIVTEKE